MFDFIKKNIWLMLGSFILPAGLLAVAFAFLGIYWGSDTSILAGDAYHQYVAIHTLYRDILHNSNLGFLYTFTNGLGLNLYAFSAYYMGSFFMPYLFFQCSYYARCTLSDYTFKVWNDWSLKFCCIENMYKSIPLLSRWHYPHLSP